MNAIATEQHPAVALMDGEIDIAELAARIADAASRQAIERLCPCVVSGDHDWYDTSRCGLDDWHTIDRANTYLGRRGEQLDGFRIVRCKAFPALVRFEVAP